MDHQGYPKARARPEPVHPAGLDRFPVHETTQGFVTLGDALADVIRFSGKPDRVELWIEDNDAVVSFTDRLARDEDLITLRAGVFYEPAIPSSVIQARNATAGLNARVQAVGKWARR